MGWSPVYRSPQVVARVAGVKQWVADWEPVAKVGFTFRERAFDCRGRAWTGDRQSQERTWHSGSDIVSGSWGPSRAASDLPKSPGHLFFPALNRLQVENDFDALVKKPCALRFAETRGRPGEQPLMPRCSRAQRRPSASIWTSLLSERESQMVKTEGATQALAFARRRPWDPR